MNHTPEITHRTYVQADTRFISIFTSQLDIASVDFCPFQHEVEYVHSWFWT